MWNMEQQDNGVWHEDWELLIIITGLWVFQPGGCGLKQGEVCSAVRTTGEWRVRESQAHSVEPVKEKQSFMLSQISPDVSLTMTSALKKKRKHDPLAIAHRGKDVISEHGN